MKKCDKFYTLPQFQLISKQVGPKGTLGYLGYFLILKRIKLNLYLIDTYAYNLWGGFDTPKVQYS